MSLILAQNLDLAMDQTEVVDSDIISGDDDSIESGPDVCTSLVFKKGWNVDSVPMEESLCLQHESSLEESLVFKRSQANSPSLDKVTSLTPHVIRVIRRL